ncbi:hypothetical protein EBB07_15445 [Paenibacillaceae bacterium]|nr:hypothetical protein EBB07_15445 [Paenibacillaceae bacterium]
MKILGIDLSVIIIALITAYIGYQFNFRSKKREAFLKELSSSYNEIYFPMYRELSLIMETEKKTQKLDMIDEFVREHSGKESKVRFIASSFILEYFYKLRKTHVNYKREMNRTNEEKLLTMVECLHSMMDTEFWDAHDTIYEDHKQFISDTFINPFFVVLGNVFKILYHISVFLFWICTAIVYFTISNSVLPLKVIPDWWNIYYALLLWTLSLMFFAFMMMFKEMIIKKNRRESKIVKNFKAKMKRFFKKGIK